MRVQVRILNFRSHLHSFLCRILSRAWVPCEAWRPMTTPTTRPAAGRGAGRARGKEKWSGPSAAAPQAPLAAPQAPHSLLKLAPVSFFYTTLCHTGTNSAWPPNSRHGLNPVLGKTFFLDPGKPNVPRWGIKIPPFTCSLAALVF